jgi:threonine dehydratase
VTHPFPTLHEIEHAQTRIRPYIPVTILEAANTFTNVSFKLENTNKTHSFKCRGALNAMMSLPAEVRARGVIAASSGNHAQGMAFAAKILGVPAKIVMAETAARRKVNGVKRLGAEAILIGDSYEHAEAHAHELEQSLELTYISPYNDPVVIAGAGTVGLEILDQMPDVQRIVVPIGGGGLISGIAIAAKTRNPSIEIVGVNALNSPVMYNHFYKLEHSAEDESLADALPGGIEHGSITIDIVEKYVDRILLVSEDDIRRGMRYMAFEQGWIAEGGGVVGLSALISGALEADVPTAIVISGGNVDGDRMRAILGY